MVSPSRLMIRDAVLLSVRSIAAVAADDQTKGHCRRGSVWSVADTGAQLLCVARATHAVRP
ncbi:hypothetical protein VSR68_19500 [Paraburkholderia phymatum]|uniref:hypothetical protein n=1 Tax=Paraburkholderia phymatum TaxID=148447 RepID=UPI0031721E75